MPFLGPVMEFRNEIFQRLKPPCVALSQAALALNSSNRNVQTVTACLGELHDTLTAVTNKPSSLDEKLADYVFFPLSQVLKFSQRVSVRCLELTFQCLAILIRQGWRSHIQPQLAGQIVILCTLMAEKKPQGLASTETTSELQVSALTSLHHLFDVLDVDAETTKALVADTNVPQLGQMISTILDGIADGLSSEVQAAAMEAMRSLMTNVATRDIKASFLPGIVSQLTKALVPQTKQRRDHKVLIGALDVLRDLFVTTLGTVMGYRQAASHTDSILKHPDSQVISDQWLETAAVQLKPAVESITRLKSSSREDVKEALARFCFAIIKECRTSLSSCVSSALETLLFLSAEPYGEPIKFQLEMLVMSDPALSDMLQSTLHSSLQSLPIQMQASDEHMKLQRIKQSSIAYGIVGASGVDTSFIDRLLADGLRDSVVVTIQLPDSKQQSAFTTPPVQSLDLATIDRAEKLEHFESALVKYRGHEELLNAIQSFAVAASTTSSSSSLTADLARSLRQSQGEMQIATFWLLLHCTQAMYQQNSVADAFLNLGSDSSVSYREYLEDLYSFSLGILTETSDKPIDPRLQALALRTLALKAQASGEDFRYELVDALYPILHTLATPDQTLQGDSITTLNIITSSCRYASVKDLIVENVDYLTNAVALKLNAFDVSPQGPQVLLMMVRLAGPDLLPYLEDTISSIFAALEDYHGYPVLVELLFRVLRVVAEEGSKAPQLAITADSKAELHCIKHDRWQATSISSLASLLKERALEEDIGIAEAALEPHPKRPWKSPEIELENDDEDAQAEQEDQQMTDVELPPPAPKTYGLLLKISDLTQHFLPSASASLRMSLLGLIKTTVPAIARHENSFLPLINTLWPEIVSRLDDPEPQVLAKALDIVAILCEYAGDFMRTRILQLWPVLIEIHQKTANQILQIAKPVTAKRRDQTSTALVLGSDLLKKAVTRMRASPADYSDTSTRLVWDSLVKTIVAAVQYVAVPPERFDEALSMLAPVLEEEYVRNALESENSDAVWLVRVRNGTVGLPAAPRAEDGSKWQFAALAV